MSIDDFNKKKAENVFFATWSAMEKFQKDTEKKMLF